MQSEHCFRCRYLYPNSKLVIIKSIKVNVIELIFFFFYSVYLCLIPLSFDRLKHLGVTKKVKPEVICSGADTLSQHVMLRS